MGPKTQFVQSSEKRISLRKTLRAISILIVPHKNTLLLCGLLLGISQGARAFVPWSIKYLLDHIVLQHRIQELPWLVAVVITAYLIHVVAFVFVVQMITDSSEKLIVSLRKKVHDHIAHLPLSFYDANLSGTIVSRVLSDVEGMRNFVGREMLNLFSAAIMSVITVFILMRRSITITLIELAVMVLAGWLLFRIFSSNHLIMRENREIYGEVAGRLTESISGIRVVKAYRAEDREAQTFAGGVMCLYANIIRARTGFSYQTITSISATSLTAVIVMFFGGRRLIEGTWTAGDFLQYMAMLPYLIGPVGILVAAGTQFNEALAGLDRMNQVLDEQIEDADPARIVQIPAITGTILVENVTFAYEPGHPVLHEISFAANSGTVTALVGPSGAGKSTIISLLSSFYKPQSGRILIDGIDLSTVALSSYRKQLGLVLQDTFLFSGTILENVLFSRPDASEGELLNACRIAHVDEFAERLPQGYRTVVGERGVRLSGGQRQRLAIARAILVDPRILILDEATSSLDSESEAMIQESLRFLLQGRTTFVIAHRISTIRSANQILVLEKGRIVECGAHADLYALGARYYDLYTHQHGFESNLFLAPFERSHV